MLIRCLFICLFFIVLDSFPLYSLQQGRYTVTLSRVNSNGTTTRTHSEVSDTDSKGRISFSFPSTLTCENAKFMRIDIANSSRANVVSSIVPTPYPGRRTLVGVNSLSSKVSKAINTGFTEAKSANPLYAAFAMIILRSPSISDDDVVHLAKGSKKVILGSGGMRDALVASVGESKVIEFENALVCNSDETKKTLASYTKLFDDANKETTDKNSNIKLANAGSLMGEVAVDAANTVGIDLRDLMASFELADEKAMTVEDFNQITDVKTQMQIDSVLTAFRNRLKTEITLKRYKSALSELSASDAQISQYNTAVTNLSSKILDIDTTYVDFFVDPEAFSEEQMAAKWQEIDNQFRDAFDTFEQETAAATSDITALKAVFKQAGKKLDLNFNNDFDYDWIGTYHYINSKGVEVTRNWPIPQVVAMAWMANVIMNGGSLTYNRDTKTSIHPRHQKHLASRTDYTSHGIPSILGNMFGLQEDLDILDVNRHEFNFRADGTEIIDMSEYSEEKDMQFMQAERNAHTAYQKGIKDRVSAITGTKDGSTSISEIEKKSLVDLILRPDW